MKYLRILLLAMVAVVLSGWVSQANFMVMETPVEFMYRENLENSNVLLPIQWSTSFELSADMSIVISQIDANYELVAIHIPYTDIDQQQSQSSGLYYVAPLDLPNIEYVGLWSQVMRGDEIVVTANMFIRILDDPAPDLPETTVSRFDVINTQWDEDNQLIAEVSWEVEDRPQGSNLVFEQILTDDVVMNIEQARESFVINSEGIGFGILQAPIDPSEQIQLRVRLFDLQTGRVINQVEVNIDYVDNAVSTQPTAIRTMPTSVPASPDSPAIFSFTITPDPVVRGGEITLSWETQGMANLSITRLSEVGQIFLESIADNLTDSGRFTYQLPDYYVSQAEFILLGADANDERYQSTIVVDIVCGFVPVYIPDGYVNMDCPVNQQTVQIATQSFENGFMLWRADTRQIYTLFNGGIFWVYDDIWTPDIVYDMPSEPPAGFIAPERGFGYLWATNESVNFQLGWATSPEQSSIVTLETYMIPARFVDIIMLELPNGRVVQIGSAVGSWRYVD